MFQKSVLLALGASTLVHADLGVFCSIGSNFKFMDFQDYKVCNGCNCAATEILCVVRTDEGSDVPSFTLESVSYEFASSCKACLCNIYSEGWLTTANLPGGSGVALPNPILAPIDDYETMLDISLSTETDTETLYKQSIFNELENGGARADTLVVNKQNESLFKTYPTALKSKQVPNITDNCDSTISCDLYYEQAWDFRLRVDLKCDSIERVDPCFSTYNCECSNGYFQTYSTMPARPDDAVVINDDIISEQKEEKETDAEETVDCDEGDDECAKVAEEEANKVTLESEDDDDNMMLIIIIAGAGAVLVIVGVVIAYIVCKKKSDLNQKISPGQVQMNGQTLNKKKKSGDLDRRISIGNDMRKSLSSFNDVSEGQQKQYDPKKQEHMNLTDDDNKSVIEMPNPDSFLGASMANLNQPDDVKVKKNEDGQVRLHPKNSQHPQQTNDSDTNAALPAIGGKVGTSGGPMQYTATGFMQNPNKGSESSFEEDSDSVENHMNQLRQQNGQ